jgi:hypothetical protein
MFDTSARALHQWVGRPAAAAAEASHRLPGEERDMGKTTFEHASSSLAPGFRLGRPGRHVPLGNFRRMVVAG